MTPVRILGLGGSLGEFSTTLKAMKIALIAAEVEGAVTEVIDLRELDLPMYVPNAPEPQAALRLAEATRCAHGFLWSSPLYHGSMSGSFKNALDWLEILGQDSPPYLADKPVGLIATAGGAQALQGINAMEYAVRALRGYTVPMVVPVPRAWKLFDAGGEMIDEKVAGQLRSLGKEVHRMAHKMRPTEV